MHINKDGVIENSNEENFVVSLDKMDYLDKMESLLKVVTKF